MRSALLCVLLAASVARAGWVEVATPTGVPTDLTVTDGGVVVVSTNDPGGVATAWRVTDAGVTQVASVVGPAIGAGFFGNDCLAVARPASRSLAYSSPACGSALTWGLSGTTGLCFRLTPTLVGAVAFSTFSQLSSAASAEGPWTAAGNFGRPAAADVLQVARVGSVDVLTVNAGLQRVGISIDGGTLSNQAAGADLRDVAPLERAGAPGLIAVATDGGLLFSPGIAAVAFQPAARPASAVARYVSVAGLRGLASTGSGVVLSPIPDPARPGETWVARSAAPLLDGKVHCVDGRWCAGLAGNVAWALENTAAPGVAVTPPQASVGVPLRLSADAGDPDGDPVFVRWSSATGGLTPVAGVADGTQVELVAGCDAVVPIDVTVSDGVLSSTVQIAVPVERRGAPVATGPASILAGGDAGRFELAVDGGCLAPAAVSWSSPTGQGGASTAFDWVPPATECSATGSTATVTATVTWPGGLGTSTASWDTLVLPWGAPAAPAFPSPAQQRSGTTVTWSPTGAAHACAQQPGFPGTELLWELDGGALATPVDGGLRVAAPSSCVGSTERFVARRQVVGETAGRVSAPGTLVVELTPDFDPLDATAAFALTAGGDGGVFSGALSVTAPCLAQRALEADVSISQGGAALATQRFPVPGPWSLPVSGACLGGTFEVSAVLLEDGADTGARANAPVTTGVVPVALGALAPAQLEVQCGAGFSGTLTLAPVAGACSAADYGWRVVAGPALESSAGAGTTALIQSAARDWSAAGQTLTLEWSADAGPGNTLAETREVALTVAPFLETAVTLEPVLLQEESYFRARVRVANPSACVVAGVELELPFGGATPMPGSVRLDGAPASAELSSGTLRVPAVVVPAGGQVELSVLARPKLLGRPSLSASARLNGQLVSTEASAPGASSGCGCSSPGGAFWLGALAFARWRRRAARVGCRR